MTIDRLFRPVLLEVPELLSELSAWNELTPFAFWTVDVLRPKLLVELGTHSGVSYSAFCQAVAHLGLKTKAYAVDTWTGDAHAGAYGEEIYRKLRAHHDGRYSAFSNLIRSTFDEAAAQFGNGTVDLLHIDGYHTYEAVKHDFETWLPKMSPSGVVLFHDVAGRATDFGVWRLWDEVAARYPSFHLIHSNGLGVAAVGAEPPDAIRWLAGLSDKEIVEVREFFARRGRVVHELLERQRIDAELGRHVVKLAECRDELGSIKPGFATLQAEFPPLKAREAEAQKVIATQARTLAELRATHDEMAKEMSRMIERLGVAHQRVADVESQAGAEAKHHADIVASIYASNSWRLTAPIRALSRAVRALKGP